MRRSSCLIAARTSRSPCSRRLARLHADGLPNGHDCVQQIGILSCRNQCCLSLPSSRWSYPQKMAVGHDRFPGGHRCAPRVPADRRRGIGACDLGSTATSGRLPWCSGAGRREITSILSPCPRAKAGGTRRSSSTWPRRRTPRGSGRGRAQGRAARTSAGPEPRPDPAAPSPPLKQSSKRRRS
jgi:hypothetical protein